MPLKVVVAKDLIQLAAVLSDTAGVVTLSGGKGEQPGRWPHGRNGALQMIWQQQYRKTTVKVKCAAIRVVLNDGRGAVVRSCGPAFFPNSAASPALPKVTTPLAAGAGWLLGAC